MTIPVATFQPYNPADAYASGQRIVQNNLAIQLAGLQNQQQSIQNQYAPQLDQASLLRQQLANQLAQKQLPYAVPDIQSQINQRNAMSGYYGTMGDVAKGNLALRRLQFQLMRQGANDLQQIYGQNNAGQPSMGGAPASPISPVSLGGPQGFTNGVPLNPNPQPQPQTQMQPQPQTQMPQQQQLLDPQTQQQQLLQKSYQSLAPLMMMGRGDLAAQLIENAREGTPITQGLSKNDAEMFNDANDAAVSASKILPLLQTYRQVLGQTDDLDFLPGVRSLAAPYLSSNFKTLQNISSNMMALAKDFLGIPAKSFTNQEMKTIQQSWANPEQPKGAILQNLQLIQDMANRVLINRNMMQQHLIQHGNLSGYQPYSGAPENSVVSRNPTSNMPQNTGMSQVQTPDGRTWSIPNSQLNKALARGAKRVG